MTQATSLSGRINQSVQDFITSLPDDEQATVQQSFEKLHASSVAADAVNTGDTLPDFSLPNATGRMINLYAALEQGPVVLSFYRGGWCPFCSLELQALQQILPDIRSLGATLIGVSPETPDNSLTTAEKYGLDFEVVSDVGNRTARDYGLIFTVYEEMRPLYLKWGLDVPACNGDDSWELPVPATYLAGTDRVVRAAHVDRDYTKRMEPGHILEALKELV
ncbi:MAG: peroxiredoxin-like family protein [Thiohalobacterales bacterium]